MPFRVTQGPPYRWVVMLAKRRSRRDVMVGRLAYRTIGEARAVARGLNRDAAPGLLYYASSRGDLWPKSHPIADETE